MCNFFAALSGVEKIESQRVQGISRAQGTLDLTSFAFGVAFFTQTLAFIVFLASVSWYLYWYSIWFWYWYGIGSFYTIGLPTVPYYQFQCKDSTGNEEKNPYPETVQRCQQAKRSRNN